MFIASMDALYLKNNVYTALTEGLASMAVALPDDKVEYLGRYLLKYVDRKREKGASDVALEEIFLKEQEKAKEDALAPVNI